MTNRRGGRRSPGLALAIGVLLAVSGCTDDEPSDGTGGTGGTGGPSDSSGTGGAGGNAGNASAGQGEPPDASKGDPGAHEDAAVADASVDAGATEDAGADDDAGPDTGGPTWSADIHPMLVGSCGNCHANRGGGGPPRPGGPGEGSNDAPGKFAVDDPHTAYLGLAAYVVARDADRSVLYIKISEDMPSTGGQRMPPALRQLEDSTIALVKSWIAAGALEN
jgi:hypothetical protein